MTYFKPLESTASAYEYFIIRTNGLKFTDRAENIVGKAENAGYQHFLLFPQSFQKAFPSGLNIGLLDI